MMHIPLNVSANRAVAIVSLTGMLVATTAARGDDWATAQTAPRGIDRSAPAPERAERSCALAGLRQHDTATARAA